MAAFHDHFSAHAGTYAEFRPVYPRELFVFFAEQCLRHDLCWDAATGNGQAAHALAEFFAEIYASDASTKQIEQAEAAPHVRFAVEPAEKSSLADASCDLVTVAQAIHWLKHDEFYREAARVLRPGGLLAVWGYGLHSVNDAIDVIIKRYYFDIVGRFWPPERKYLEKEFDTLPFPYKTITAPQFSITADYSLEQMIGYLLSWSATQRYIKENGENPLGLIADELKKAWGNARQQTLRWPIYLKAGFKA